MVVDPYAVDVPYSTCVVAGSSVLHEIVAALVVSEPDATLRIAGGVVSVGVAVGSVSSSFSIAASSEVALERLR